MKLRLVPVTLLLLLLAGTEPEPAAAGVLLKSSRVSSRVNTRPPRVRLGRTRKSTAVMARLNPIGKVRELGGVENQVDQVERYQKYQRKLHRWERKRARAIEKHRRKLERKKRGDERRRRKEQRRLAKKMQREKHLAKKTAEATGNAAGDDAVLTVSKRTETGEPVEAGARNSSRPKSTKRTSFWSRFWQAVVGKKRPEPKAAAEEMPPTSGSAGAHTARVAKSSPAAGTRFGSD